MFGISTWKGLCTKPYAPLAKTNHWLCSLHSWKPEIEWNWSVMTYFSSQRRKQIHTKNLRLFLTIPAVSRPRPLSGSMTLIASRIHDLEYLKGASARRLRIFFAFFCYISILDDDGLISGDKKVFDDCRHRLFGTWNALDKTASSLTGPSLIFH